MLLQNVTLVYAFVLSLLDKDFYEAVSILLRQGCHKTVKRCRKTLHRFTVSAGAGQLLESTALSLHQSSG
jgi:hypothetical protein